jgi:hypothetical protein
MELFPKSQIVGVFRGFREGGLEFHADLALPYRTDLHSVPMHGQFLLVQLESPEEAVLGRITAFSSEGKLSVGTGEEFNIRAVREGRDVPEDLREQYLKYRVNIRVLGVLRNSTSNRLSFIAPHRRLPHVGSPVAFLSADVLREVASHHDEGAAIGHLALGEYVYEPGRAHDKRDLADAKVSIIITSPPHYGLDTYPADQWLRAWFLGEDLSVNYSRAGQINHGSPAVFAEDLRTVWKVLAGVSEPNALLVVRFGGINERRYVDPLSLLKDSLTDTPWQIHGDSSSGHRL